jgi:hypothetical protein
MLLRRACGGPESLSMLSMQGYVCVDQKLNCIHSQCFDWVLPASRRTWPWSTGRPATTCGPQVRLLCPSTGISSGDESGQHDAAPATGQPHQCSCVAGLGIPPPQPHASNMACTTGIKGWSDEASLYNFAAPGYTPAAGHFTCAQAPAACTHVTCIAVIRQLLDCCPDAGCRLSITPQGRSERMPDRSSLDGHCLSVRAGRWCGRAPRRWAAAARPTARWRASARAPCTAAATARQVQSTFTSAPHFCT